MIVSYPHETRRQNDLSISSYLCKFQPTHCLQIREFYGQENKHWEREKQNTAALTGEVRNMRQGMTVE